MLECRACLLRSIRAIAGDAVTPPTALRGQRLLLTPRLTNPPIRRSASTAAATKDESPTSDAFGEVEESRSKASKGVVRIKDEKALRAELRYLTDPLKLAEHVRYTLRSDKPEKALDLCRLASRQQEVIVSWNHCVDWHMSHGDVDGAIKIYNEMKKRAQFPDSYTYILLLRGLSKPHHHGAVVTQSNVTKAMSIYNSMSSPTSRVKPSIYHTNATLRVCSAALDMDSLWSVAARLPSKGHGAPDHVTYAIILNAIRHGVTGSTQLDDRIDDAPPEQIAARRQEAINQGRRIWQEIIPKWRGGEIQMDEELVGAMGRLLLISKRLQDWDDVFNLVQQTMNIERQIAPLGSNDRNTGHVPQELEPPEEEAEDSQGYRDAPSTKAFNAVTPLPSDTSSPKRPPTLAYVTPFNGTLSLLISTCTLLRTPRAANAYWDLLTSPAGPYNLKPDLANFHAQFRLLGINRSSARAVKVLQSMPDNDLTPENNTFRVVMSVCLRDKNNAHALEHAHAIVDEMTKHSKEPDVQTLIQYLVLAGHTNDGPKIVSALNRVDPIVDNFRSRVNPGVEERSLPEADVPGARSFIDFFQTFVSVIDTITHRRLVSSDDVAHWQARRQTLTQFIGRAKSRPDRQPGQINDRTKGRLHQQFEQISDRSWGREQKAEQRERGRETVGGRLQIDKTEFAFKRLPGKEKSLRGRDGRRQKARGLLNWDVSKAKGKREGRGRFADSPMELGMR